MCWSACMYVCTCEAGWSMVCEGGARDVTVPGTTPAAVMSDSPARGMTPPDSALRAQPHLANITPTTSYNHCKQTHWFRFAHRVA